MTIEYRIGDALSDFQDLEDFGPVIIVHVCNTDRVMGAGIARSIALKWPNVLEIYENHETCDLGQVQLIRVRDDVYVLNMIAQTLRDTPPGEIPLSYPALEECLMRAAIIAQSLDATIVGPKFGSALAGGDWNKIEEMIESVLSEIEVVIFDLPPRKLSLVKK